MIVDQVDVADASTFEAEDNPPVAGHRYAPKALEIALKSMQAIARQIQILRPLGHIQQAQDFLYRVRQVGAYPPSITSLVEPFQSAMPKAPNHTIV